MAKNNLKDIAYDYILDAISTFRLKPGDPIVEQEISDALDISRTPIREALKALEAEGLVEHFPSRGTFVAQLTTQDIDEIYQLKIMFETEALKQAIHYIPAEDIAELKDRLEKLRQDSGNDGSVASEFFRTARDLHMQIISYSGNSRLVRFYSSLEHQQRKFVHKALAWLPQLDEPVRELTEILLAIEKRDLALAEEKLRDHLAHAWKEALRFCRSLTAYM